MKEIEVFRQDFRLYESSHQKHLKACVDIPRGTQEIIVFFKYGPIIETNQGAIRRSFEKEGLKTDKVELGSQVRNLLTITINDPDTFRGAHHYFNEDQEIHISEDTASLGFRPDKIQEGEWEFIVSCHGIFSDYVEGSLTILVNLFEDFVFTKPLPLTAIDKSQEERLYRPLLQTYHEFKRVELHAHTLHSDAAQSTQLLLDQARDQEIDWLAITDHNTTSSIHEAIKIETGQKIIPGLEYTTFHGHMVIHGPLNKIDRDWTEMNRFNSHQILAHLQKQGMNITIAHPFDQGNPYCTGCRWDYYLENLTYIDAIEVWNSEDPHLSESNRQAFTRWVELINQGIEINAVSGRDWHRLSDHNQKIAFTYVLLSHEAQLADVLQSLKLGRTYSSIGPIFEKILVNGRYQLGDRITEELSEWSIDIEVVQLSEGDRIDILTNHGLIDTHLVTQGNYHETHRFADNNDHYVRIEIYNKNNDLIAFTNPIYRQVS